MQCKQQCLRDVEEYGPLGYCEQCKTWYKEEGEEANGVYEYCTTKNSEPERCDEFIQNLIMRVGKIQEGEKIPIADTTLDNIRRADQICAACDNKHFVLE